MLALHIVLQGAEITGEGHLSKGAHQRARTCDLRVISLIRTKAARLHLYENDRQVEHLVVF